MAGCWPYSRPAFILGSGRRTHERPTHWYGAIYVGAVLPSKWLDNLARGFTDNRGLTTYTLAGYLVDQSNKLSSAIKKKG
jgi:hypothetical protein